MKILVIPLINEKPHGIAIQGKKFNLKLRIINTDIKPTEEFKIKQLHFKSASGQDISNDCENKEFSINKLNPAETYDLNIGDFGHPGYGLLTLNFVTTENGQPINFEQQDAYTDKVSALKVAPNRWTDFFFVESLADNNQNRTNNIMLLLTIVLLFLTILQVYKIFEDELNLIFNSITTDGSDIVGAVLTASVAVLAYKVLQKLFRD